MASVIESAFEQLVLESAQDARALQRREQDAASALHKAQMATLAAVNHRYLLQGVGAADVATGFQGVALKSAVEPDSSEAIARGQEYKDSSTASLPMTQAAHSSVFNDQVVKSAVDTAVAQILAKLAQSTAPQTGHSVESPEKAK